MKIDLKHEGSQLVVGYSRHWRVYHTLTWTYRKPLNFAVYYEVQRWTDGVNHTRIHRPVSAVGGRPLGRWRLSDQRELASSLTPTVGLMPGDTAPLL